MIEARPSAKTIREWQDRVLEEMGLETDAKMRGVTRLLLRPQRAGRVRRVMFPECGALYWTDGHIHPRDTRAQAAKAAYK